MTEIFRLSGIDCAACAAKAERKIQKVAGIKAAAYNFLTQKLTLTYEGDRDKILADVTAVCKKIDKNTLLSPLVR